MDRDPQISSSFRWQGGAGCRPGLEWITAPENQIAAISRLLQDQFQDYWNLRLSNEDLSIDFISEGTWNRAFKVTVHLGSNQPPACLLGKEGYSTPFESLSLIFRLSVPMMKSSKTQSEVATMRWVKQETGIPVPDVFLYDATGATFGGYEWILMEHMPGVPFSSVRETLSEEAKISLASTIADWVSALWSRPLDAIGSIYQDDDEDPRRFRLGRLCSQQYMGDWRSEYEFDRGPFHDMRSFCLSFANAAQMELDDDRQFQRSGMEYLSQFVFHADLEYIVNNTSKSSVQHMLAAEKLKKETKKKRRLRHCQLKLNRERLEKELKNMCFVDVGGAMEKIQRSLLNGEAPPYDFPMHTGDGSTSGLVPLCESRYEFVLYQTYTSTIERLTSLIKEVLPDTRLPTGSCVLNHWDISENNVLVDPADGRATALLDWEQLFSIPVPALIDSGHLEDSTGFGAGTGEGPGQPFSPAKGLADAIPLPPILQADGGMSENADELERMRLAYRHRLQQLFCSPAPEVVDEVVDSPYPSPPPSPDEHTMLVSTMAAGGALEAGLGGLIEEAEDNVGRGGDCRGWRPNSDTKMASVTASQSGSSSGQAQLMEMFLGTVPYEWGGSDAVRDLVITAEDVKGTVGK